MDYQERSSLVAKSKEQFYAIDIVKFVCAILVVTIHIPPFGLNDTYDALNYAIQNFVARVAVPFFFVSSGFFLYKKSEYENFDISFTKKYLLKLLRLYVIWSVIYLPYGIKKILSDGQGIIHGIFRYVFRFVFVGDVHLWYLNATIVGVAIISFLLYKKCKAKSIIIVSAVFYVLGLLGQSWFGIIKPLNAHIPQILPMFKMYLNVFETTRNGLFDGFLFIAIGMLFAFTKININKKVAVGGLIISFVLLLLEVVFVKHHNFAIDHDMYIFLVPATFFMFYIAKNIKLKNRAVYIQLRQLSSLVFYLHIWVSAVVTEAFSLLFKINVESSCLKFVLTLVATIIASLVIIRISDFKSFRWLKKLYC